MAQSHKPDTALSDKAPVKVIKTLVAPVRALFVGDAAAGVLLILVAAAALVVANSPLYDQYHALFHDALYPAWQFKLNTWHLWINDGLMAIFFFVVGLEVKRELIEGQLSTPEQRRLPALAAAAGMAMPALIFILIVGGGSTVAQGWAIPAATDIAFAMGVLGLLGNRVPASLRLFLLTVAIVDDIGAVLIIAVFYTAELQGLWLVLAALVVGVMIALNRMKVSSVWPYLGLALVLWYCVLHSGVHATIAGVVAALCVPMTTRKGAPLLGTIEHALAPWSAYLIVPVFGFANAGVHLGGLGIEGILAPLPLAVGAGLLLGKQLGIFSCIAIADRIGFAPRPSNASWAEIWGVSVLCGIGFTMSLFIGELAFPGVGKLAVEWREEAKIGVLGGSILSATLGYVILRLTTRHLEEDDDRREDQPASA